MLKISFALNFMVQTYWLHNVTVPERLRGLTRNQLGSACAGSSPAGDDFFFFNHDQRESGSERLFVFA